MYYYEPTPTAGLRPVPGVSLEEAQAAIDRVTSKKVDLVGASFKISGPNARKLWYHLGRMFQAVSYSTTADFSAQPDDENFWPFYQGAFQKAIAACARARAAVQVGIPTAETRAVKAVRENFKVFGRGKYCPTDREEAAHCTARPGCKYFAQGDSDHVCTEDPGAYCRSLEGSMVFSDAADGKPPGCHPVGSACTRLPDLPAGRGGIDASGLCRPKNQISLRPNNGQASSPANPESFYRALEPVGLADDALRELRAATRDLYEMARRAVASPGNSCGALGALSAYWSGELAGARQSAEGCFRILIEPAWDRGYAGTTGERAYMYDASAARREQLTDRDVLGPHPAVVPLLRFRDSDPGFTSWGAWK